MSASERRITELERLVEERDEELRKLKHLLGTQLGGARTLLTESGVNKDGVPFVRQRWGDEMGQLTPDEARTLAVGMIDAAAAAEFDAGCVKVLTGGEFGAMTMEHAMTFLSLLREARHGDENKSA